MMIVILVLLLSGCAPQEKVEQHTKYPNVPTYGIVMELQKEEEKWKQKK